jgi:hypothetical protein
MTAARDPAPDYEPEVDETSTLGQVASDVDALRRKLDEQASTLRRNHQAMTALADSLGKVVEAGRKRDRRAGFNSFVAYIIFTVLVGGGALLLYRSRASELVRAKNDAVTDLDATRKELQAAQAQLQARDAAAARAYALYQSIKDGKRVDVTTTNAELAQLALTPTEREVLADAQKQARAHLFDAGVAAGADDVRKGDFARAIAELTRAAGYGAPTAASHYWLGVALVRAKGKDADPARAVDELRAAVAEKIDQDDARFWLGVALEGAGKPAEARKEYEKYAAAQPTAPYAAQARARWVALGQPAGAAAPQPQPPAQEP